MTEIKCGLCKSTNYSSWRRCTFGKEQLDLCKDCLAQFKVENERVVLYDRLSN